MAVTRQLGREDVLFVASEKDNLYYHTAGLVILDTSDCPGFHFEWLKEKVIERIDAVPHFRWRLHEVPMGLDLPYWVEDENFSYDHHFRRIAVPSPGDRQALSEVVALLYSRHLDRRRPLWEFWLIEGLAGGRCALLQKLHHCMMDGQGASRLGEMLCDFEPAGEPRPVDASITGARAGAVPAAWRQSAATALHLAQLPGRAYREMFDVLTPRIMEQLAPRREQRPPAPEAPVTVLNAEVGTDRGFVFGSLSLDDIKTVKNAFAVTVNDVVLALVAASLRDYLLGRDALPALSLRSALPVSLRSDEDEEISNRVTQKAVTLATDVADPLERLRLIHEDCERAKRQARGGGKGIMEVIQLMPPLLIGALAGVTTPEQLVRMFGSNTVISSVRGSDRPMYVAGARMETMYPMSIVTPGMGINFTCVSYAGQIDVGITIDPTVVPHAWDIMDGMGHALAHYLALAKKRRPGRSKRKAPVTKRAAGKTGRSRARAKGAPARKVAAANTTGGRPRKAE